MATHRLVMLLAGPDLAAGGPELPPNMVEAPELSACVECWRPDPCPDHVGGLYHRWQPTHGSFVLLHPARTGPLVGRFKYPVDANRFGQMLGRHLTALAKMGLYLDGKILHELDAPQRFPNITIFCAPDPDVPAEILQRLSS